MVICADNPFAQPNWNVAFYLTVITTISDFQGTVIPVEALKQTISLGENAYVEIPQFVTVYKLKLEFPKWHKGMKLQIWAQELQISGEFFSAETQSAVVSGQPLILQITGKLALARNDDFALSFATCFGASDANPTEPASYITEGQIFRGDWSPVVGVPSLIPGATYYLASTPGTMSAIAPTDPGYVVVALGKALTTNLFDIEIQSPILL
ncbi:MAG: hypothetical protein SFY66_18675 [Oculatellaceae cyanobacterium bins.114]|nr:hypothetical protein [Oculatellaceae cyanobacterium bins.114]